jgi:hypothetical protein
MNKKEWLYIGGAVASLVAVAYLFSRGKVYFPQNTVSGAVSDADSNGNDTGPGGFSPGYTGYNMGPIVPQGLATSPEDMPAGIGGSGSCCSRGCAGYSIGDNSTANLAQFLNFMQNTDPTYLELQRVQLQNYAALFSTGEKYSNGATIATAIGVQGG